MVKGKNISEKILILNIKPIVEDDFYCGHNCPYLKRIDDCDYFCLFTNEEIIYYDGLNANCIED